MLNQTNVSMFANWLAQTHLIQELNAMLLGTVDQFDCIAYSLSSGEWRAAVGQAINTKVKNEYANA